eukprot:scpid65921/ scgid0878/ Probable palmitoyltransferase ZDHHC14; NEW1 domain-containing protein; Zinc finger DHHC domain-containing protein 14
MARRKWETFPGKMRFCCDGRLMCGQDIGVFAFAIGLITVASGVFFGFTCPYLSSNVSPAIPVFAGVLMLMSLAMLVRTGTMDPGILPRATGLEAEVNETGRNQTIGADDQPRPASEGYTPPARTKMVTIQNMEGTVEVERMLKYCFTCKIFRPPRASHCSICDACVDQFDHHCPWVGNCVGRRNYRYFYGFLATLSLYCIYVLAFGILHLVLLSKEYDSFSAVSRKAPLTYPHGTRACCVCIFKAWRDYSFDRVIVTIKHTCPKCVHCFFFLSIIGCYLCQPCFKLNTQHLQS